ncbi:MAG TPA: hypothetical protein VGV86_07225 [Acidimicrobiales bacterium]|nr:hypothetical protein [Acidimicrobiales bacterium]
MVVTVVVAVVDGLPGEADREGVAPLHAVAIMSRSPAIRETRIESTVRAGGQ